MSNFYCDQCHTAILEDKDGYYMTGCQHYPLENRKKIRSKPLEDLLVTSFQYYPIQQPTNHKTK